VYVCMLDWKKDYNKNNCMNEFSSVPFQK